MEDSGVQHILNSSMTEDLTRLFRFFKCVQGGVKTLLDCVSKHLRNLGRSIVNEHGDSVSLIPEMMDLRDRFDYFIQHSFDDDEDAKKAIATDLQYLLDDILHPVGSAHRVRPALRAVLNYIEAAQLADRIL
ncbi:hypothetical protein HPB52_022915 [Rhipicephalus sanguineus]|uniref:Cullin N-terminal domain-containing protein n=1 Tax=Rhipicephalus sanguineus TaxID=34632 RepID=A0A9D4Q4B4_RHISA|nr:hypothetical protein HPB52_022915 [Rhipicephalus sanguineus]